MMENACAAPIRRVCLFCGEKAAAGEDYRGKHIVRNMEEIAFTVVNKLYEEWDFYSDSSDHPRGDKASPRPAQVLQPAETPLLTKAKDAQNIHMPWNRQLYSALLRKDELF